MGGVQAPKGVLPAGVLLAAVLGHSSSVDMLQGYLPQLQALALAWVQIVNEGPEA